MKIKNKLAFTLVELIVVATILTILSTIGFVSYSGYLAGVRDINRVSQLNAIGDALHLYTIKSSLPIPDAKINITTGAGDEETILAYQGYVGKDIIETIGYTGEGKDPKDNTYYSYYLTKNRKYFQLMAFLEEASIVSSPSIIPLSGENEIRYPHTEGKKLGILTDNTNTPIQEIYAIKNAQKFNIDNVTNEYKSYFKSDEILTGSGKTFSQLKDIAKVGGRGWAVKGNKLVYKDLDLLAASLGVESLGRTGWRALDLNCNIDDIIIGGQTWAGCNSTLGYGGFEWGKKDDGSDGVIYSCYDYDGKYDISKCTIGSTNMLSNESAKNYFDTVQTDKINNNGDTEFDTIWGKFYTWVDSSNACPSGRHVPSDGEWEILENNLGCSYQLTENGRCKGLGWKFHNAKTIFDNIVNRLLIPLSGLRKVDGSAFGNRGLEAYLWSSSTDGTDSYYRKLFYQDTVSRDKSSKNHGFSVRCIKDNDN